MPFGPGNRAPQFIQQPQQKPALSPPALSPPAPSPPALSPSNGSNGSNGSKDRKHRHLNRVHPDENRERDARPIRYHDSTKGITIRIGNPCESI